LIKSDENRGRERRAALLKISGVNFRTPRGRGRGESGGRVTINFLDWLQNTVGKEEREKQRERRAADQ